MSSRTHRRARSFARAVAGTTLLTPLVAALLAATPAQAHQSYDGHLSGPLSTHSGECVLPLHPAGLCQAASNVQRNSASSSSATAPSSGSVANGSGASPDVWSVVPSQNLDGHLRDSMASVSCTSAADCWAVGDFRTAGDYSRPLVEHWNGSSWQLGDAPVPQGSLNAELTGVSCTSASDCLASGSYSVTGGGSFPFSERWDGATWSLLATPYPSGEQFGGLRGVTCVATGDCWAVGWSFISDYQALDEHWDGTSWSVSTVLPEAQLNAVTCTATNACWAVGGTEPSTGLSQPFVAQWDGSSWTPATAAAPPGDQDADLDGVTCANATVCWAVGRMQQLFVPGYQPLIEQLSGGAWSVAPSGVPSATVGVFNATACASATSCYAVGSSTSSSGSAPLLDQWNGSVWSDASPAAPPGAVASELDGVTCQASACWTVGNTSVPDANNVDALLYQLNGGSWTLSDAPVPVGTNVNAFGGVACVSASSCIAVGSHTDGAYALTLGESWNGTAWSATSTPSVSGMDTFLNSVACVTATDCWAVGDAQSVSGTTATPVIDSWDGSKWTSVSAPVPNTAQVTVLNGVTCVAAGDCWAVGASFASSGAVTGGTAVMGIENTLAEHWDGTSWSIVSSPNNSPNDNALLNSVTCVSSSDCWAAGITAGNAFSGLLEQWNGSQWQVVASPQPPARTGGQQGTPNGGMFGVTCVDASDCWAAGYSYLNSGSLNTDFETWMERWDGNAWNTVSSPNPSPFPVDALFSVSCASANDCWTVGTYGAPGTDGGIYETLTLHWDGTSWTWVDSPNGPGNVGQTLTGVTCGANDGCWSVGGYNLFDGTLQTLAMTTGSVAPAQVPEAPAAVLFLLASPAFVGCGMLLRRSQRSAASR